MRMLALHQDPGKLRGRVVAGFETLKAQAGVDASRIGALGFCFGGQCVLELARSGVDAQVGDRHRGRPANIRRRPAR